MMEKSKTSLRYESEWMIGESFFEEEWLNKYEALMAQGNGYLGIRAVTEESYTTEIRNFFVAGTFNRFSEEEVTELPNLPDPLQMNIYINNERLNLNRGKITDYNRTFNFQNGELIRSFIWTSDRDRVIYFEFKRCVSMLDKHFIKQKVSIKPLNENVEVKISSGINGRMTNSGTQHFVELEKRKRKDILQMKVRTIDSDVEMVISTMHDIFLNGEKQEVTKMPNIPRRQIKENFELCLEKNEMLVIEKTSSVFTSRDFDFNQTDDLEMKAMAAMEGLNQRYETFIEKSSDKWQDLYNQAEIKIESINFKDQLLLNFSRYHLHIMTHELDNRVNIGAKGLSGEGYKGHTFWDTDIFILPYFTFCYPDIAQNLVEYRFKTLEGAREKARGNQYIGAQIPWECAWLDDGETTPLYGDVDIITGEATKILTGIIEDHVSSDVIFGYKQFLDITGREEKELEYAQLVLETALFWTSRARKNQDGIYEILDVIGPDEYKEHVNNNTYTNTMAKFNVDEGIRLLEKMDPNHYRQYKPFLNHFTQEELLIKLKNFSKNVFVLPFNKQGILPQDDNYLQKKEIDISQYKEHENVNEIFKDYNLEQVNQLQVSKQADVLLLMVHFFHMFDKEIIEKNFDYYEERTLHDSSLSLSTHSLLASLLSKRQLAYEFFEELYRIDLGDNMFSSTHGIHSASMGGVWQSVILGFGGLSYDAANKQLHVNPKLPPSWKGLTYQVYYQGEKLEIDIKEGNFLVRLLEKGNNEFEFYHNGVKCKTEEKITI